MLTDSSVTLFEQSAADSDSKSQLATLVLRGSTVNILDDFERAVTGAVAAYKTMTKVRMICWRMFGEMTLI